MRTNTAVVQELTDIFDRSGYVRRQNPVRVAQEGWTRYKKGDEVRLCVCSEVELERLRSLLVSAGFKPGSPYEQGNGYRQPLYGRKQVAEFLELIGRPIVGA